MNLVYPNSFKEGREILFYKLMGSGLHTVTGPKQNAFNKWGQQTPELNVIDKTVFPQIRECRATHTIHLN